MTARVHPGHLQSENLNELIIAAEHPVGQTGGSDELPQEALWPDLQQTCAVSQELRALCTKLGMKAGAVDGWAEYHTSPVVAMTYYIFGQLLLFSSVGYLITGAPFSRYYYSIPLLFATFIQMWHFAAAWHTGPNVTMSKHINGSLPVYILCMLGPYFGSFLGPTDQIPFGNVVHFTACVGVYFWARVFVNQVGFFHTHGPAEPRSTYLPQIFDAMVVTVRFLDCFTDMAFFRVLLHEKEMGCWWFGISGRCDVYNIMIVALIVCAGADFALTFVFEIFGQKIGSRTIMTLRAVSLVSELGVISITILDLVSGSNPHGSEMEKQQGWGAIVASLATTVVAFCLSLLGAGSALSGAKVAATRVSEAVRASISKSGFYS